jgi:hypothetical protein
MKGPGSSRGPFHFVNAATRRFNFGTGTLIEREHNGASMIGPNINRAQVTSW